MPFSLSICYNTQLMIRLSPALTLLSAALCLGAHAEGYVGQVLVANPELLVVKGEAWSGWVDLDRKTECPCVEGDIVRIQGSPVKKGWLEANRIAAEKIVAIRHEPLPPTFDVEGYRIPTGELVYSFVRTTGTVASVVHSANSKGWNWLTLRTPTGGVGVTIRESYYSYGELRALIDADVSIRGLVVHSWGNERHLGAHLTIRGKESIRVLKPASVSPFDAPVFSRIGCTHRQRLSGSVAAAGRRRAIVLADDGFIALAVPSEDSERPVTGRRVTLSGFAETDPLRLRFTETLFRNEGPGLPPTEPISDIDNLKLVGGAYHGSVIAVSGPVLAVSVDADGTVAELATQFDDVRMAIDVSALDLRREDLPGAGSIVQFTGACVNEYESSSPAEAFPRFRGIVLIPRAMDDIKILRAPPWWTPFRLLLVILFLLLAIAFILMWNRAIKIVSERRGHELYNERIGHALAEQKVEERTRLAIELHDSISQTLTGVSLQLDGAAKVSSAGGSPLELLSSARQMLASCRGEMRRCLWDLRSRTFEETDMTEAVMRTLAPHMENADVQVRFNVPRERLSESTVHTVLRIIRELVVNAIRHGGAKSIKVAGEYHDGTISFSVRDNGCGFDPETAPGPQQGHFGLQGVRERLDKFNGNLVIESLPGKGTRLSVTLDAGEADNEQ